MTESSIHSRFPPKTRMQLTRLRVLLMLILAVTSSGLIVWHFASAIPAPTTNSTCEPGACSSEPCSYKFYNDTNTILGKNCKTGANDYSGTMLAVWNSVISACPASTAGSCGLRFAPGIFSVTATLTDTNKIITITGEGSGYEPNYNTATSVSKLIVASDIQMFDLEASSSDSIGGFRISHILLEGVTGSTNDGLFLKNHDTTVLDDVAVRRFNRCIVLNNEDAPIAMNLNVQNCAQGLVLVSGGQFPTISTSVFADDTTYCIADSGAPFMTVSATQFVRCGNTNADSASVWTNQPKTGVTGNSFWKCWETCVSMAAAGSKYNTITGNRMTIVLHEVDNHDADIICNACSNSTIVGNVALDDQVSSTTKQFYVELGAADFNQVTANNLPGPFTSSPVTLIGVHDTLSNNLGENPIGAITNFIENTGHTANPFTGTATPTSATTYTVKISEMQLIILAGTVTAIVVNGKTIATVATTEVLELGIGDTFSVTFSVAPTWQATFR